METLVKLIYQRETGKINIICSDKAFDVSNIKDLSIEQWVFPFYAEGIRWKGLYEELKDFTGCTAFTLQVESDESSFKILKYAMEDKPVAVLKVDRPIVTIIYAEDPFATKITIDGNEYDTTRIINRSIDEWLYPISIRGMQWDGIFKEIENYTQSDSYIIYFVGEQRFMDMLINQCPNSVNIFFRDPQVVRISKQIDNSGIAKQASPNSNNKSAAQFFSNSRASKATENSDSANTDQTIKNYQKQLEALQQEEFQPSSSEEVKNPFYKLSRMQIVVLVVGIIVVIVLGILGGNSSNPYWLPTVGNFIINLAWLLAIEWLLFYITTLIYYVADKRPVFQRYFKQYAPFVASFIMFYAGFGSYLTYVEGGTYVSGKEGFYHASYLFLIVFIAIAVCLIFWMVRLYKKRDYLNKPLFLVFKSYKPEIDDDEFQQWQAEQNEKIKDVADKLKNAYDNLKNKGE